VSVLVASGDAGVGGAYTNKKTTTFTTAFPASCPWVTAVRGTSLNTTGPALENAWIDGGGSFSEIFGRPSYQNATISKWLAAYKGVTTYFNQSGRAYPDVSAQGVDFAVAMNGALTGVSGQVPRRQPSRV
jgi:tripeptidyl-peptidase I